MQKKYENINLRLFLLAFLKLQFLTDCDVIHQKLFGIFGNDINRSRSVNNK